VSPSSYGTARTARKRREKNHNSVHLRLAAIARRERRPSKKPASRVARVEIQIVGRTLTKSVLHRAFGRAAVAAIEPGRVGRDIRGREIEAPTGPCECRVENTDLLADLAGWNVSLRHRRSTSNYVKIDVDGAASGSRDISRTAQLGFFLAKSRSMSASCSSVGMNGAVSFG
jgi:hypothetical protein